MALAPKKTVADINVTGKRVLLRVDFNVPMNPDGTISDDTRIRACLPTIKYLVEKRARVIIASHMGRPNGKVVESMRMAPTAKRLSELFGQSVRALNDCVGPHVKAVTDNLQEGEIAMLENLRFYPAEEANDPTFSRALAELADVYVNDAFAVSHRAHASVVGVTKFLPAVAGFLMDKELKVLGGILEKPEQPFAAVLGGAKVSEKLGVINNIMNKVNSILIGGGMAATFLKSRGYNVGSSPVEEDKIEYLQRMTDRAKAFKVNILLPQDVVIAEKLKAGSPVKTVPAKDIPEGWIIADIGPQSIAAFAAELNNCRTVIWNGPMGVFEIPEFANGTREIARTIANLKTKTVIGGGSTAEAVTELGLAEKMYFVSTGGGASLEFLEGKLLPGVSALQDSGYAVSRS